MNVYGHAYWTYYSYNDSIVLHFIIKIKLEDKMLRIHMYHYRYKVWAEN